MSSFICSDWQDYLSHGSILIQMIVSDSLLRSFLSFPLLNRTPWTVNFLQQCSVGLACFLLKVSNKTMTEPGAYKIGEEKKVHENPLWQYNAWSHKKAWFS